MNEIKEFWGSLNKFYFCNVSLVVATLASILLAFTMQFKVEALQDQMANTKAQIVAFEDQIGLLEVEWTYLTRPARLRELASRYLKDNGYTLASQIKGSDAMDQYYLASYSKGAGQQVALNAAAVVDKVEF